MYHERYQRGFISEPNHTGSDAEKAVTAGKAHCRLYKSGGKWYAQNPSTGTVTEITASYYDPPMHVRAVVPEGTSSSYVVFFDVPYPHNQSWRHSQRYAANIEHATELTRVWIRGDGVSAEYDAISFWG
jgi:hypothetical protein